MPLSLDLQDLFDFASILEGLNSVQGIIGVAQCALYNILK